MFGVPYLITVSNYEVSYTEHEKSIAQITAQKVFFSRRNSGAF